MRKRRIFKGTFFFILILYAVFEPVKCSKQASFSQAMESADYHLEQINRNKIEYSNTQEQEELLDKVLQESKYALELNPQSSDANGLYARALLAKGKMEEAYTYARKAIDIDPENFQGNIVMGHIRRKLGDLKASEAYYRTAIRAKSDDVFAIFSLSLLLQEMKHLKEAESLLVVLVEEEPENIRFLYSLASVYEDQRDLINSAEYYKLLLDTISEDPNLWRAYARVIEMGGDTNKARYLYSIADSIEFFEE